MPNLLPTVLRCVRTGDAFLFLFIFIFCARSASERVHDWRDYRVHGVSPRTRAELLSARVRTLWSAPLMKRKQYESQKLRKGDAASVWRNDAIL